MAELVNAVVADNERQRRDARTPPGTGLYKDVAFWGMTSTQFLGAFNDNLFKQLMLLLAVPVAAAAARQQDQQGLATVVFSLPFILFSGYAGYLSDRYSKKTIIVASKVAEIAVMLLGMIGFALYGQLGYRGLLVVLFLMGTQSAFFGPGKYGILPEMLRERDLPRANGVIVMTTFLAIIFGTASAGLLGKWFIVTTPDGAKNAGRLWIGSAICVAIAIGGTATALLIRRTPRAKPDLSFLWSSLAIPPETRHLLAHDFQLLSTLLASCVFWLVSGLAIQAVNSLGLVQLRLDEFATSIMTAIIGLGIAGGAVIAGRLCHGRADFRIVRWGQWGMVVLLALLSISLPGGRHLLGYWGGLPALALLGMSAGFFAIPLQVFLQSRPPDEQKGRMIAVMNQANFTAILLSGILYSAFDRIVIAFDWPRSVIFGFMMLLLLPMAILFRLDADAPPSNTPAT